MTKKTNSKKGDLDKLIRVFFSDYLPRECGLRPNTLSSYADTFRLLLPFLKKIRRTPIEKLDLIKDFSRATVLKFLDSIEKDRGCGPSTRNLRLAAIKTFCRFVQIERLDHLDEIHRILAIRKKKTEQKSPDFLTLEGITLLFNQPNRRTSQGIRHLAVLCLIYDAGARVTEIINVIVSSITFGKEPMIQLLGKGNKLRNVPLINAQMDHLINYMKEHKLNLPASSMSPLFTYGRMPERLTRAGVTYILNKYTKMARAINPNLIPARISLHSLRHSKAMHLVVAGVDMIKIRDFLGHKSVAATDKYARMHWDDMIAAIKKADIKISIKTARKWKDPEILSWLGTNFRPN